jgi:molecular chaperone HscA
MSKAWATAREVGETLPLVIGKPAGIGETLAVPSSIFIADNGRIYFGRDAERQHRADSRPGRTRFDNLKRMLSEEQIGCDLFALSPRSGVDPTESGLTQGDLLVLYLAWLTDVTEKALKDALLETDGTALQDEDTLRAVKRRFAIPCFEDAEDDHVGGIERARWAREVMRNALLRAQVLADSLSGKWNNITTALVVPMMKRLHELDVKPLTVLLMDDAEIREPIAAGASRFDSILVTGGEPSDRPVRRLLMVVDAGAGTTDFAMFQAITPAGKTEPRYALLRRSVRMSRIAGNEVDSILRPLILESCGINPETGYPRSEEDFQYIKADLDSQLRDLKRLLFDQGTVDIELKPNARGTLELAKLLSAPSMEERARRLLQIRERLLTGVFGPDQIEEIRVAARTGSAYPIYVLLTGGSSGLPIIRQLATGEVEISGTQFRFSLLERLPDWIDRLPRDLGQRLASVYAQCAVAIGGSVPELPKELADFDIPITPPLPGERRLERVQMRGI